MNKEQMIAQIKSTRAEMFKCIDKLSKAKKARDDAINNAWDAGLTRRSIADAAELSLQTITQLARNPRPKGRPITRD